MKLEDLRGWMTGEDCLVVAPGPSSRDHDYTQHWTVCCNRACVYGEPDIVVCMEPARDPVWEVIHASAPYVVISHQPDTTNPRQHNRVVHMACPDVLQWLKNEPIPGETLAWASSAFYGAAAACLLGFGKIGLIGVDLSAERYTASSVAAANARWQRLAQHAPDRMVNLSPESQLTAIPQGKWEQLKAKPAPS